jgi:site-specific recombinase XerC
MITRYIANCSSFRAKATVYATLSTMRGFGDYLVRQGLWKINSLLWMKGPKVTPYGRLPKQIDHAHMEAMWREAANRHGKYTSHLRVTVRAMLFCSGLRLGELERLNLDAFDRTEGRSSDTARLPLKQRTPPQPVHRSKQNCGVRKCISFASYRPAGPAAS